MDFYEELGVLRTASDTEIRKAYKCITMLLHPDQQQNPQVRALAEGQMKRINEVVEILTDPQRRRIYDQGLHPNALVVRQMLPLEWLPWIRTNRGWVLVGAAFLVLLAAALVVPIFDSAHSGGTAHEPEGASSASSRRLDKREPADTSKTLTESRLPSRDRRISVEDWNRDPGLQAPPVNFQLSPARTEKPFSETIIPPPAPAQVASPPGQSAPSAPRAAPALAGRWVYTPDPSDPGDPTLYPAEYVELLIAPVGNALRGVYQARYKLPGHTLNSRVNFTFEGPLAGTSFAWQGDSGAQGEIAIRLESTDTLKVNWFATKMGPVLSLGSGNATLYRFR